MSTPIPDDILILIVDELANDNNRPRKLIQEDLLNLISASRDFWFPCRQRLYGDLTVTFDREPEQIHEAVLRFLKLLEPPPSQSASVVAPFIKSCQIDIGSSGVNLKDHVEDTLDNLAATLDLLHGVQSLSLVLWLYWEELSQALQLSLHNIIRSKELKSLTLEGLLKFPAALLRGTTFANLTLDACTIDAYNPSLQDDPHCDLPQPRLSFLHVNFLVELDPSYAVPPCPFFPHLQTLSMEVRNSRWADITCRNILTQAPLAQHISITGAGGIPRPPHSSTDAADPSPLSTRQHLKLSWRISVQRNALSIQRTISEDRILNLRDLLTIPPSRRPLQALSLTLTTNLYNPLPEWETDRDALPPVNEVHWRLLDASLSDRAQFPCLRLVEVRFEFSNRALRAGGLVREEGVLVDAVRAKLFPLIGTSSGIVLRLVAYFE